MTRDALIAQDRQRNGLAIIDLSGEINAFAEGALSQVYTEAENDDPEAIIFNFNEVKYINSTGKALIVGLLARARKAHRKRVVSGLSNHYVEIFEMTPLADFMSIYPDESNVLSDVELVHAA